MAGRAAVVALVSLMAVGAVACSSAFAQNEDEPVAFGTTKETAIRISNLSYLPDGGFICRQLNIVGSECVDPSGGPVACCLTPLTPSPTELFGPYCVSFAPTVVMVQQVGKGFCCDLWAPWTGIIGWVRHEDATQPCGFCGGKTPKENECCTRDRDIVQKYPINGPLEDCPDRVQDEPAHPPRTNFKCGSDEALDAGMGKYLPQGYGQLDWKPNCETHDKCYSTCRADKAQCDATLFNAGLTPSCRDFFVPQITQADQARMEALSNSLQVELVGCLGQVKLFRAFVQDQIGFKFGERAFEAAQRYACRCCP
jgi:hypothetical protein